MEPTGEKAYIDPAKKPVTTADILTLIAGIAGAIKVLLAAPPFEIELPQETLDAWLNFIGFVLAALAMYRNNRRYKNAGGYYKERAGNYKKV